VKFVFHSIGKTKEKNLFNLEQEYLSRISKYIKCETKKLKEAKNVSKNDRKKIIAVEGLNILTSISSNKGFTLCLDERGKQFSTLELADLIQKKMNSGEKQINFVVGGPFGLSEDVKQLGDVTLSLSKMTFTHEMSMTILLEQIYRAMTVLKGQNYHY